MTLEEAKQSVKITDLVHQAGIVANRTSEGLKVCCPNPGHNDTNPSCAINEDENVFNCFSCGCGGSVVDWVSLTNGITISEAIKSLGVDERSDENYKPVKKKKQTLSVIPKRKPKAEKFRPEQKFLTKTHIYTDLSGTELYRYERYDYPNGKKDFRARAVGANDELTANMDSCTARVPFRFPLIEAAETIYFVEGEKCANAMIDKLGVVATTTCGGSKAWFEAYSIYFQNKNLILIPDNDKTGREFMRQVAGDCKQTAKSVRILDLFNDSNPAKWDVADEIEKVNDIEAFKTLLDAKANACQGYYQGATVDAVAQSSLTALLRDKYERWGNGGLDLRRIFPAMAMTSVRPFIGGTMVVINASTGAGKTSLAMCIAHAYQETPIAWFTLELSKEEMHERHIQIDQQKTGAQAEALVRSGKKVDTSNFEHIYIYDQSSRGTVNYIREQVKNLPLVSGERAGVVVIDYIQLMPHPDGGASEYERITYNAVEIKKLAIELDVVIIALSQIGRKDEANIGASKGSGAIEESCGLLISMNSVDECTKRISFSKNSKGTSDTVFMDFKGETFSFPFNRPIKHSETQKEIFKEEEEEPEWVYD